jgi:hypothetical protein
LIHVNQNKKTKTVYIFGDSYAELQSNVNENTISWVKMLHDRYNVKNYAVASTGIEFSQNQFVNVVTNQNNLEEASCFFFVSEYWRPYFNFWETPRDHNKFIPLAFGSFFDGTNKFGEQVLKKYKSYKKFCKEYYLQKEPLNAERDCFIGCISTINTFSKKFKNVLVWPCFNNHFNTMFSAKQFNKNLQYIPKSLFEIVDSKRSSISNDTRINHMNDENNLIMFNELTKRIETGILVDYTVLKSET